ncbi:MAG: PD40 domain-containing protein [Ignavibacteria bacterium]|nr:PD40 domain-containing protein [Ignavibacteria bacterium]
MQTFWNINNGGKLYFAFIILLLSATILFYTASDSPIKPLSPLTDSEKTKHGIEPAWSPAGNRIAYIGGATDKEFGIYDIDVAANENPRKIAVPEFASNPDWSPDGKWIVYSRNGNIWKKAVEDDSSEIQLTSNAENFFPSWSKDGEWIAFDSNMDSPSGLRFVWKMRADGSEKKRIIYSPQVEIRMPDWFPDELD